jgi:uncharacterized DUF497 family protein
LGEEPCPVDREFAVLGEYNSGGSMDAPSAIRRLVWDAWNRDHITKHGVTEADVNAVIDGDYVALESYKQRSVVVGLVGDRVLAVVVGPVPNQPGVYYPFSARPASRKERRYYRERFGGDA